MTKFEKIIILAIVFLFVAVMLLGVVIFQMKKSPTGNTAIQNLAKRSAEDFKSLEVATKQFYGTIENISGNQLTINAKLMNFSKPKNPDKNKNAGGPVNISGDDFAVLDKKITVNTNEKTLFTGKTLSELKVGDSTVIIAEKSPYTSDTVTAEKVTSSAPK